MNIYAIRDRLIDYFMQPFCGPDDKTVQASVARLINQGEITSDIAQAPHQFEIWKLGSVTEDGHLVPERELVQDCAALVRVGIRKGGEHPNQIPQGEPSQSTGSGGGNGDNGRTPTRPLPDAPQAAPSEAQEVLHGPRGGYPPRNGQ